jgi:hypothetical protein
MVEKRSTGAAIVNWRQAGDYGFRACLAFEVEKGSARILGLKLVA